MNFDITKAPPTEVEVKTHFKKFKVLSVISFGFCLFLFSVSCFVLANFLFPKVIEAPIILLLHVILLAFFFSNIYKYKIKQFSAISKDKCEILLNLFNDNEIEIYCKKVASQGREIIQGEYDAIILLKNNKVQALKNMQQELACKKLYTL